MNEIIQHTFKGAIIRIVIRMGDPWFIAMDVCKALGIKNSRDALRSLDEDERSTVGIADGTGGNPNRNIISESGLYSLVMGSRKPQAKEFKKWVTKDVLPSIRKTGSYSLHETPALVMARGLVAANAMLEQKDSLIAELKPKAFVYDEAMSGKNTYTLSQASKILGFGPIKFPEQLRADDIIYHTKHKDPKKRINLPFQKYLELGYFVVRTKPIEVPREIDGVMFLETKNTVQCRVTFKGLSFLSQKYNTTVNLNNLDSESTEIQGVG